MDLETHLNQISELEIKQGQLGVEGNDFQERYLQNISLKSDLRRQIAEIAAKQAQQQEGDLLSVDERKNRIEKTRQRIAQLENQVNTEGQILSPFTGKVLQLAVLPGQRVNTGMPILSVQQEQRNQPLMAVAYLPDKEGKRVVSGATAQVTPSTSQREQYGSIIGTVSTVGAFPVQTAEVTAVVGNPETATALLSPYQDGSKGNPIQVIASLKTATTPSGYRWSASRGPAIVPSPGTTISLRVQIDTRSPISYVLPFLREVSGIN
jgi:HlyD family secretion protein